MKVQKLLGHRVQVKPLPQDEKASGSIFYAPGHKPEQQIHEVIAVGTGRRYERSHIEAFAPIRFGNRSAAHLSQSQAGMESD